MIHQAQQNHSISLKQSWVIGDKTSDIKLGENAGCKTILVNTGKAGNDAEYTINPNFKTKDLLEAAKTILEHDRHTTTN